MLKKRKHGGGGVVSDLCIVRSRASHDIPIHRSFSLSFSSFLFLLLLFLFTLLFSLPSLCQWVYIFCVLVKKKA